MHHTEEYKNHDELRGRFTVWLEKVVKNAKINYIKDSKGNLLLYIWKKYRNQHYRHRI